MSYLLPSGETTLTGACAFGNGFCVWSGRSAYGWDPDDGWTSLSEAPTSIDSGFELKSGVLAGADTHVGFLPTGSADWAGWVDLSTFSNAHPMYGDLLLCTDRSAGTYALFDISASGLDPLSRFGSADLGEPIVGWSPPTNDERILLLGDGGLWALDPPYTAEALQHLVSFDGVDLPSHEHVPGSFQPGVATVVVPRRTRSALRLDLSDGTGTATGLAHVSGGRALWAAYLRDDRATASRLLATLAALPAAPSSTRLRLLDALADDGTVRAVATSAGLWVPDDAEREAPSLQGRSAALLDAPVDRSALVTWALWLGWDGALDAACRQLCNAPDPEYALAESLRILAGAEACRALFDLLRSSEPPAGPDGNYEYPLAALRALVAPFGAEVAPLVSSALSASSVPARVAACAAAGATRADVPGGRPGAADREAATAPALWGDDHHPLPEDSLRANLTHDHPAVRTAARDTCARLSLEDTPSRQTT